MRRLPSDCAAKAEKDDAGAFIKFGSRRWMEEDQKIVRGTVFPKTHGTAEGAERQISQIVSYTAAHIYKRKRATLIGRFSSAFLRSSQPCSWAFSCHSVLSNATVDKKRTRLEAHLRRKCHERGGCLQQTGPDPSRAAVRQLHVSHLGTRDAPATDTGPVRSIQSNWPIELEPLARLEHQRQIGSAIGRMGRALAHSFPLSNKGERPAHRTHQSQA